MNVFKVKLPRHDGLTGALVSYMRSTPSEKFGEVLQKTNQEFPLPIPLDMRLKFRGLRYHLLVNTRLWLEKWDKFMLPDYSDLMPGKKEFDQSDHADCCRLFESVRVTGIYRDLATMKTILSAVLVGADGQIGEINTSEIEASHYSEFGNMNMVVDDIFHDAWLLVEVKKEMDSGTVTSYLATLVKKNVGREDAEYIGMTDEERIEAMCEELESKGKIILHPENYLDRGQMEELEGKTVDRVESGESEKKLAGKKEKAVVKGKGRKVVMDPVQEDFDDLPLPTEAENPIYPDHEGEEVPVEEGGTFGESIGEEF